MITTTTPRRLSALLACLLALCLSLTGCGGGGSSNTDQVKAFAGTWELSAMSGMNDEDLELFKSTGSTITLVMAEDGTFTLDIGGASTDGTWEAESATKAIFHLDGEDGPITLADGTLAMESGENTMSFVRVVS